MRAQIGPYFNCHYCNEQLTVPLRFLSDFYRGKLDNIELSCAECGNVDDYERALLRDDTPGHPVLWLFASEDDQAGPTLPRAA